MPTKTRTAVRKETRPWGGYQVLLRQPGVQVKRIEVKPGLRFSLQKHTRRAEKWIVISGKGTATVGRKSIAVVTGSFLDIPRGVIHRVLNKGTKPLIMIEVQFGRYLGEDDIVRFEDDFGRL